MFIPVLLDVSIDDYLRKLSNYFKLRGFISWDYIRNDGTILQLQRIETDKQYYDVSELFGVFCDYHRYYNYNRIDIKQKLLDYKKVFLENPKEYFDVFLNTQKQFLKQNHIIPCLFREEFDYITSKYECVTICISNDVSRLDYSFDCVIDAESTFSNFYKANFLRN